MPWGLHGSLALRLPWPPLTAGASVPQPTAEKAIGSTPSSCPAGVDDRGKPSCYYIFVPRTEGSHIFALFRFSPTPQSLWEIAIDILRFTKWGHRFRRCDFHKITQGTVGFRSLVSKLRSQRLHPEVGFSGGLGVLSLCAMNFPCAALRAVEASPDVFSPEEETSRPRPALDISLRKRAGWIGQKFASFPPDWDRTWVWRDWQEALAVIIDSCVDAAGFPREQRKWVRDPLGESLRQELTKRHDCNVQSQVPPLGLGLISRCSFSCFWL